MIDPILATIVSFGVLVLLLASGMPIAIGLGLSGIIGLYLAFGLSNSFLGLSTVAYNQVFSFGLLAVPLFIFMGNLLFRHGIGADLYDTT
jgi:TRAP-type mannitol/chloroaromatic compound transport system permease large subunit